MSTDTGLIGSDSRAGSPLEVLFVATKLGLTSFGGPVAHLGYYHNEYVLRRRWLSEHAFAEVVALAQALPGPASSQVSMAIGLMRAGLLGALMAWIGFTLPSAAAMVAFGYGLSEFGSVEDAAWLHGLTVAAVAIVAFAVWGMARTLAPDKERASIAIVAAIAVLSWESAFAQIGMILLAGVAGWFLFRGDAPAPEVDLPIRVGRNLALGAITLFLALLLGLPLLASVADSQALDVFDSFYRTGSLVFGGGHVVLPLLEREVVAPGWVSQDDFLAGYGAVQAVPGPLFTFSAFLGTVMGPEPNGLAGGGLALVAVFLPSFLLVLAGLPLWALLRRSDALRAALRGVNAGVVGLLLAALYTPVWVSAIESTPDFSLAAAAFGLLAFWRLPPWSVVAFSAIGAEVVAAL